MFLFRAKKAAGGMMKMKSAAKKSFAYKSKMEEMARTKLANVTRQASLLKNQIQIPQVQANQKQIKPRSMQSIVFVIALLAISGLLFIMFLGRT